MSVFVFVKGVYDFMENASLLLGIFFDVRFF